MLKGALGVGMANILVIDDEPGIVRFVRRALENDGHTVTASPDGAEGLRVAATGHHDLIILDLLMPGVDGLSVLAALTCRDDGSPIIVLSALGDVSTRVRCLDGGAADFLPKPFAIRELLARVHLQLRHLPQGHESNVLTAGRLRLDLRTQTLHVDGRPVQLSRREYSLLAYLMSRAGAVCTREELLSEVWGYSFDPGTNVVDVYIRRLRTKLCADLIGTVRNAGYTLRSA